MSASTVSSAPVTNPITAQEPQLRAAVILGIIRFTSWPHQNDSKKNLNVCTLGEPLSKSELLPISNLHKVANRTLIVSVLNGVKNIDVCDVLIFGPNLKIVDFSRRLQQTVALPIITICDGCNTLDTQTTIKLIQRSNRIGFEVNLVNANKQKVIFSSSLLEIASEVRQ